MGLINKFIHQWGYLLATSQTSYVLCHFVSFLICRLGFFSYSNSILVNPKNLLGVRPKCTHQVTLVLCADISKG